MPAATDCDGAGGGAAGARGSAVVSLTPPRPGPGGLFLGWERVPQGRGGSSSMQPPLKMESSTEEESWLEDQWEKW